MANNVTMDFAEPFLPLFDYLSPENKRKMWNDDLAKYTKIDESLYRFIGYEGGRGGAKSQHFARALLTIARMETLLVLGCREVQNTIRDSVHRLLKSLIYELNLIDYQVMNETIRNRITGSEFIFKGFYQSEMEIKSLDGVDICWVEEAQSLSERSIKILRPTIRKARSQLWFSYNRFKVNDPVHDLIFKKPTKRTYHRHINYDENPFFENTELYQDLLEDIEKVKNGDMSEDEFAWIWLGEPLGQDERALIKRSIISACIGKPLSRPDGTPLLPGMGIKVVGSDPSGLGKDRMALTMFEVYPVQKLVKGEMETINLYREIKYKEIAKAKHKDRKGHTIDFVEGDKSILINIDATNMQGYGEDLADDGYNVQQVHFAERPKNQEMYSTARDEMAFELEEKMRKGHVSLLKWEQRENEMQSYQWEYRKRGERVHKCLEEKKLFKKREGISPDGFDCTALALYTPYKCGVPYVGWA